MSRIAVGLGNRSYDIIVETGIYARTGEYLAPLARNGRVIIVTETNVATHVLPLILPSLAHSGLVVETIVLPAGEATKSWGQLEALCNRLIEFEVERQDHIVALGGGVIGDLVGFAAAIIKRGCKFIQMPTSLLAQVDSSVGGKTAINTKAGKNLIGAFHQPSLVLIDPTALETLSDREKRAGYAEIVKYGLLGNFKFFEWCEAHGNEVIGGNRDAQIRAIMESVQAKAAIVESDEHELEDRRALLNLGHTFGHALEAEMGYTDALLHGEAVSVGMALAFRFSAGKGLCSSKDSERVSAHLRSTGLSTRMAEIGIDVAGSTLTKHISHDKKKSAGTVPFILCRAIGDAYVDKSIDLADVAVFLDSERD